MHLYILVDVLKFVD